MLKCVNKFFQKIAFLAFFLSIPTPLLFAEKPIIVLITSYNNKKWAQKNVVSALKQEYSNYRVLYIDDASQDETVRIVQKIVEMYPKKVPFQLIRNEERKGALANIYHAIHDHCKDEEIIVSLDGDDWFFDAHVLKKIDLAYSSQDIWLTHGTMIEFPINTLGWSIPVPEETIDANAFRKYRCPSHLRTFYAWLFKRIQTEDLQYQGKFFTMTWDQAMMFPMIEMSGKKHAFISDIVYVYNIANPINDNKVDPKLQNDLEAFIRAKPAYECLEDNI